MQKGLWSRLFSATLMLMMAGGGGSLPILDGLLFHRDRAADVSQAHYETTGSCHSDGCTIRSTAHQARFAPSVAVPGPQLREAESRITPRITQVPFPFSQSGQPLSRAPPFTA